MLDCEGGISENKDRVRALMSNVEENNATEVIVVIIKVESLLINKLFYESQSDHTYVYGCLGNLMYNDRYVSRPKISIYSTNPLSKECLDNLSIGTEL